MSASRPPPQLELSHDVLRAGAVTLVLRRDWRDSMPLDALLSGAALAAWGEPLEHGLHGRGAVHVLATTRGEIVAKAFQRGGIVGGVLRTWYVDPWRPAREAVVAESLLRLGCPTPPVVVARATRGALGLCRLEIATERVVGARDLLETLRASRRDPTALSALAARAGRTLRRLHDVGLHHRDLQVKNLLVPSTADGALVVLDLDRCQLAAPLSAPERVQSLARFGRSLVKNGLLPGLSDPGQTPIGDVAPAAAAFVNGYGPLEGVQRGVLLREVTRRLRRSLRTHELLW